MFPRSNKFWLAIIILLLVSTIGFLFSSGKPKVKIRDAQISVELATSPTAQQRGLSGRLTLDQNSGMLFIFPRPAYYRFWMPDMHFPLDFIWIGSNDEIVDITKNVSNKFDPANPIFYSPIKPAQYVLEVNADFSQKNNLAVGDKVIFEGISS